MNESLDFQYYPDEQLFILPNFGRPRPPDNPAAPRGDPPPGADPKYWPKRDEPRTPRRPDNPAAPRPDRLR